MKIAITGGAGYIGSHACVEFLNAGHEVVVIDNLINSSSEALKRVEKLTGKKTGFFKTDLLDFDALDKIFSNNKFDGVIHFAGLKAVGESVEIPVRYYQNNITGTLNLLEVMKKYSVNMIVFSSSATVYGDPHKVPITEDFPVGATNPYGRTKQMIEEILKDAAVADENLKVTLLRYFNPIGAHKSGDIGEDPKGIPNNLVPYIAQVAVGKREELSVFGNDYPTVDGTGVRDYIHVVDLAAGHVKAFEKLDESEAAVYTYNLGTGRGYSVLEVIEAFKKASDRDVPYRIIDRRAGDIAVCYADASLAEKELGWKAEKGIDEMCSDTWRWQSGNPDGYSE